MPYKVSDIEDRIPQTTAGNGRFSFSILARGRLVCTMSYAKREDAEQGKEHALKMIENAAG
jgi:hypothetical protein